MGTRLLMRLLGETLPLGRHQETPCISAGNGPGARFLAGFRTQNMDNGLDEPEDGWANAFHVRLDF